MKNKNTAGILGILLGGVGIHKFYLGRIGAGIIYVLFCWTFIPSLVGFVEGIIYLTMSQEDFDRKYNDGVASAPHLSTSGRAEELEKLHSLKERGAISEEDYLVAKRRILH